MSITLKNKDLVLQIQHVTEDVYDKINKYDLFLETLSNEEYDFQRDAIKQILSFIFNENYNSVVNLARENYELNKKLKIMFSNISDYLNKFQLANKKACTVDLATGTGKSFVLYGISLIMLCEGLVDKVIVLCPSLTIEEELTKKFTSLNSNIEIHKILKEINPAYCEPEIVNANSTILNNQICVENIHSTYERTGSSIEDSFKKCGERVLVLNDEAHHIFSGVSDSKNKKWLGFLLDNDYNFKYIINLTGTPYYIGSDEYFYDVIYRFSIKDAVEKNVIKKIDYKVEEEYQQDKGFDDTYAVHENNKVIYGRYIKPISIIVTAKIVTAIQVWNDLVNYLANKESISIEEAKKKVIWVTSGLPSNKSEKEFIESILPEAEKTRKENLELLKTVDDNSNAVEWIISVSMLTEGWDVKNVFQVVPHEAKAFESKLLISQVLGRGLRIPQVLKEQNIQSYVKVNNHQRWTPEIMKIYDDVLEVENRLVWGIDSNNIQYKFNLYNLEYTPIETTIETKENEAKHVGNFGFMPQDKVLRATDKYQYGTQINYDIETKDYYSIDQAVKYLYAYLKQKNSDIVLKWSKAALKTSIISELINKGYPADFLSKENYINAQKSFGPLFVEKGKKSPRISLKPDNIKIIDIDNLEKQTFSEDSLKSNGALFYTEDSKGWLSGEQKELFIRFTDVGSILADTLKAMTEKLLKNENTTEEEKLIDNLKNLKSELQDHVFKIEKDKFKCSLNIVYVSYKPEIAFVKSLFNNIDLIDSFIKSPDKGFYAFPYSYKPETKARTHVHHENFNPDFFIKIGNDILVIEIKKEGDDSKKNKAKLRDGKAHFELLNSKLEQKGIKGKYYFKFLSPENNDYLHFWQAVTAGTYREWTSTLMLQLSNDIE